MFKLLTTPLLPTGPVKTVLLSGENIEITHALNQNFGIETIETVRNIKTDNPISLHADCQFLQIDENTMIVDEYNYNNIVNFLTSKTGDFILTVLKESICSPYPEDVKLNVRVFGRNILGNISYMSDYIKDYAQNNNINLIHTNQGYSACSTILLNKNALITDDISNYESLKNNGIDCIFVSKGSVVLNGYDYGFIGGTCGMIDKNVLAFTGSLDSHSDAQLIKSFLNYHHVKYIELTDGPLIDIGGIIPIFE